MLVLVLMLLAVQLHFLFTSMRQIEFEQAVKLFSAEVYGIAYCNTHNNYDSEDITQNVFVKLWMNKDRQRFESADHLKWWLIRVTTNCVNDHWRAIMRHPTIPLDEIDEPAVTYEYKDEMEELYQLKPKEQMVLRMYYYEGYSFQEIAAVLGISEVAVRKRLSRARKALKASICNSSCIVDVRD